MVPAKIVGECNPAKINVLSGDGTFRIGGVKLTAFSEHGTGLSHISLQICGFDQFFESQELQAEEETDAIRTLTVCEKVKLS